MQTVKVTISEKKNRFFPDCTTCLCVCVFTELYLKSGREGSWSSPCHLLLCLKCPALETRLETLSSKPHTHPWPFWHHVCELG